MDFRCVVWRKLLRIYLLLLRKYYDNYKLINCYIGDNRSLKCKDSGMMVQAADRLTLQTCLMRFFRI